MWARVRNKGKSIDGVCRESHIKYAKYAGFLAKILGDKMLCRIPFTCCLPDSNAAAYDSPAQLSYEHARTHVGRQVGRSVGRYCTYWYAHVCSFIFARRVLEIPELVNPSAL